MDVFVSYSRQDSEVISPLVALLRCAGVDVFMDVRSIAFGEDWKAAINRAITSCDRVLVAWSTAASTSEWVEREYLAAKRHDKPIVPLLLDATPLPPVLADFHGCADLLPLISTFRISLGRQIANPEEFLERETGYARQHTARRLQAKPAAADKRTTGIREKLRAIRHPRCHIAYRTTIDASTEAHRLDESTQQLARTAANLIASFGAR